MRKIMFIVMAIFSTAIGIYPIIYFLIDRKFGLLQSKSDELLASISWNAGFYTHITLGGLALLIGWTQFIPSWRDRHLKIHRNTGKVYVVAALVSSLAAIYIALYATGGIIPSLGFICLGIIWFLTTFKAYANIRKLQINHHRKMMVYSYACCFAAVTLRIYLPVLTNAFHDFNIGYSIVAWLCWIPNLVVAYIINRRTIDPELSDMKVVSVKSVI